ncbi:MAG: O-methyltransferase [Clostridia bacterium]
MDKSNILEKIKEEARKNYVPILQDVSLKFILNILKEKKPNNILEIGTAVGYSAINFTEFLCGKSAYIKTIEISDDMYEKAKKNVADMELEEKIILIHDDATKYLSQIDEKKESFDVIFIDAAKGQYLKFLEHAIRLAKNNSVIIADNVLFKGRVLSGYNEHRHRTATNRLREYLKIINEDKRLISNLYEIGDGIAVSIVKK